MLPIDLTLMDHSELLAASTQLEDQNSESVEALAITIERYQYEDMLKTEIRSLSRLGMAGDIQIDRG